MSKRKFKKGRKVKSLDELYEHEYFIVEFGASHTKTVHATFLRSWQVQTAKNFISIGLVHVAVKLTNGEYYEGKKDEEILEIIGNRICEFCPLPDDRKGDHCYGSLHVCCEGYYCGEAVQSWKEDYVE